LRSLNRFTLIGNVASIRPFDNVVKITTYVTDVRRRMDFRLVRDEFFGLRGPASTMVEVSSLSHPDYLRSRRSPSCRSRMQRVISALGIRGRARPSPMIGITLADGRRQIYAFDRLARSEGLSPKR